MWTTPQFKFNDKQLIKCRFSIKGWLTGFETEVNKRYQSHNLMESTSLLQTLYYNIISRGIKIWTLIYDFGDRYSNQLNYTAYVLILQSIRELNLLHTPWQGDILTVWPMDYKNVFTNCAPMELPNGLLTVLIYLINIFQPQGFRFWKLLI